MQGKLPRLVVIAVVVGAIAWFGVWIGGPGGFSSVPPARGDFSVANRAGVRDDSEEGQAAGCPAGMGVPLVPEGVTLLEQARLDRSGVLGAVFTVEGAQGGEVVRFYRAYFAGVGWHELPGGADEAAKAGVSASVLYTFAGRGGTFFLGCNVEGARVHFVTMHMARGRD